MIYPQSVSSTFKSCLLLSSLHLSLLLIPWDGHSRCLFLLYFYFLRQECPYFTIFSIKTLSSFKDILHSFRLYITFVHAYRELCLKLYHYIYHVIHFIIYLHTYTTHLFIHLFICHNLFIYS